MEQDKLTTQATELTESWVGAGPSFPVQLTGDAPPLSRILATGWDEGVAGCPTFAAAVAGCPTFAAAVAAKVGISPLHLRGFCS